MWDGGHSESNRGRAEYGYHGCNKTRMFRSLKSQLLVTFLKSLPIPPQTIADENQEVPSSLTSSSLRRSHTRGKYIFLSGSEVL
jgi:hypothetical protein